MNKQNNKKKQLDTDSSTRTYSKPLMKAVTHPTRRKILKKLAKNTKNSQDTKITTKSLETELDESRYNLYHHLAVLEKANLIQSQSDGRQKYYTLADEDDMVAKIILSRKPPQKQAAQQWVKALNTLVKTSTLPSTPDNLHSIDEVILIMEHNKEDSS